MIYRILKTDLNSGRREVVNLNCGSERAAKEIVMNSSVNKNISLVLVGTKQASPGINEIIAPSDSGLWR
jgi:hypothetical protein